jgi:hypothetical protein
VVAIVVDGIVCEGGDAWFDDVLVDIVCVVKVIGTVDVVGVVGECAEEELFLFIIEEDCVIEEDCGMRPDCANTFLA